MDEKKIFQTVASFLEERNMCTDRIDMDEGVRVFREEMLAGLNGEESSLQMIPTYISAEGEIPKDQPVIVLDAGGTNFRVAEIRIDSSGDPVISGYKKNLMPGSKQPVGREEFFNTIVDYMQPLLDKRDIGTLHVGFCFSYPTEIYPDHDGRLIHFTKEVKAPEVEGELIGAGLISALHKRGYPAPAGIVLLNDTVATLLAAKAASASSNFDSFVGFILGTGTNSAYIECNANIKKLPASLPTGSQVINMESGSLKRIIGGTIDEAFDATTKKPGDYRFEKMVSGAYIGPLCGTVLQEALRSGLFSDKAARLLSEIDDFDTITVDRFLHDPGSGAHPISAACRSGEDRLTAFLLMDNIVERAAKLAAINISATVLQEGSGTDPTRPIAVCADGTTLYKTRDLLFRLRYYLKRYLEEEHSRYIQLLQLDDAPLIGSAVAALLSIGNNKEE